MISINDVARKVGVAKSTVSNALTGKKYVSPELKEKVLKACKELDYTPNFYASSLSLSDRKTHIIAILLEYRSDMEEHSFYGDLVISSLATAAKKKYSVLLFTNDDNEVLIKYLKYGKAPIDGAILLTPNIDDDRLKEIQNSSIECVIIGRPGRGIHYDYIDIDNYNLTREVAEMLSKNYKEVYLLNASSKLTITEDRKHGFFDSFSEEDRVNASKYYIENLEGVIEEGYQLGLKYAKEDVAFITCNSRVAVGLYKAIHDKGLKVGSDVGVFALGKSHNDQLVGPKLSYAIQDYKIMGRRATEMLIDKLEKKDCTHCVLIKSKWKITDSIKKIKD